MSEMVSSLRSPSLNALASSSSTLPLMRLDMFALYSAIRTIYCNSTIASFTWLIVTYRGLVVIFVSPMFVTLFLLDIFKFFH